MTVKEIDGKLEEATNVVGTTAERAASHKVMFSTWKATLDGMQTRFGPLIAEINGLDSDAWSDGRKAKLARIITEYQALQVGIDAAVIALGNISEF